MKTSKHRVLGLVLGGFAVLTISIGIVTGLMVNNTYAAKVLNSMDPETIAKKTQAQALSSCLRSASIWSGKLEDYSGRIFESTSTESFSYIWYGSSSNHYQFNRTSGNCNNIFGSSYSDLLEFQVNVPEKYKANKADEIKAKLIEIGYYESNGRYYMDSAKALKYFTGYTDSTMLFNDTESAQIIAFYINADSPQGYGGFTYYDNDETKACDVAEEHKASDAATAAANSGAEYVWLNVSTTKRCAVKAKDPSSGVMVYTIQNMRYNGAAGTQKTFKELVDQWNVHIDYMWKDAEGEEGEDLIGGETIDPITGDEVMDEGGQAAIDPCYNAGASLGWIICPTLDIIGKAVVGIYDIVVQPFLEIKSDWLSTSTNSVYGGWKQFRDFANIIFAIAFAIIILAQVTGIGISNYNIKKILPRLIMVVVLVNLSYVICQIAVDISNILGSSLQNLFNSMAMKVDAPPGVTDVEMYGGGGTATWFSLGGVVSTGLTIVLGGATLGGLAVTWEFWLPMFLLTVLGCAVGVLFFFIILGVRQAGVLILTALAPVAIVCYALPNTKSFFDKWKKMYMGLLIVYPICGALIGGGQFASALLIAAGGGSNFFYDLVAMLIQVVPFFLIPSILRSSMAAMGNLGAKIAMAGNRVGGFAKRTAGNSRFVQEKQREWARNNNQRRDMKLANRYKGLADTTNAKVKGYEDRLRSAGVDLSDTKAVRRFLGDEYGAYRRAKNKAASVNYRANQARRRYESSVMEDAAAATGASRELLAPGTKRYESYMEGLESAQRVKDAADQQRLFEAGRGTYTDAGGNVHDINAGDISSLESAHAHFLEQLRDNPNDVEARAKLEAVQDMLAARGDKGHEAMYRSYKNLANSSSATQLNSEGLRYAANHLSKYAPQIKKGSRSFDKLLNQYQAGTVDSFRSTAAGHGKTLEEELDTNSALGYNASSFNDMNEDAIQRYIDMAEHGKLDSKQLQHLTKIANEALNNDEIQLKGDVEKQLHDFLSAAYGTGAVGHSTLAQGQSTIGSDAIKNASLSSLNDVAQRIQNNDITGAAATKLVENARRYMESGETIDADRAQALRKIISTAQVKGVDSLDKINGVNAGDNFSYDEASFKVRGAKATAKMPTGWTRNTSGTWVNITSGAPLTPTEVRKAEEIERYNNQRDIESGKYS